MLEVLYYEVGKDAVRVPVEPGLKPLQDLVGGCIETVRLSGGLILVCNEEGRIHGLQANRYTADYGLIVGNFFITTSDDEGEFASLSNEQVEHALSIMEGQHA